MKVQPPLENAPGTSCGSTTDSRGVGKLAIEIDGRIALAGFGQHEGVDALVAGELRQVPARFLHRQVVGLAGIRILLLQFVGIEIELLLGQRGALRIDRAAVQPPFHQHRREKFLGAFFVVRRW